MALAIAMALAMALAMAKNNYYQISNKIMKGIEMKKLILILAMVSISMASTVDDVLAKLSSEGQAVVTNTISDTAYTQKDIEWRERIKLGFFSFLRPIPLSITVLSGPNPTKMIFLIAAGNHKLEYFTNNIETRAQSLRKKGYLVVAITPRVDNLIPVSPLLVAAGIHSRIIDVHSVVKNVRTTNSLDYTVEGFSYGAFNALAYASEYPHSRLDRLNIVGLDSHGDSLGLANSLDAYNAANNKIWSGEFVDSSAAQLRDFVAYVSLFPDDPSSVPGLTNKQLLFAALTSPDPNDFALGQSAAGNPFALDHFDLPILAEGAAHFGSAWIPQALHRDFYGAMINIPCGYNVNFNAITADVMYVNGELGYGDQQYWCSLIPNCNAAEIPNYGHIDMILGDSSAYELSIILQD